ncbi:peptidoglycan-binding protein [Streptomyces sp. NPDC058657]|uniref:peptidoglycan-binding protein n=1 Tax=unclassified Streptomyces TaxID=2593676 RepID=UPI0036680733
MSTFHVAVDHLDPDTSETTTAYYGTVDQDHVDTVRALAALPDVDRHVLEHPRIPGALCVLRVDGDLDVYVPVDAPEPRVYPPDPEPRTTPEGLPRGATGPAYIDGVLRLGGQRIGGAMDTPAGPPRMTWHTTESPAGGSYLRSVAAYLMRVGAEPQVIYDPVTDELAQFGPLTQSGRALRNDGSRRTNREGKVNVQVEVLARAKDPWTRGFDPAKKPNFRKLLAAGRAHGIPDVWPAGKPAATASAATKRDRTVWQTKGGHYGHCNVPGNDHWDPGAIDTSIVPGKPPTTTPSKPPASSAYEPFPGANFFHTGRRSPIVTAMGRRLVAEGCGRYNSGPGPQWTLADKASFAAWQRKYSTTNSLGWSAEDCNGIPGKTSWDALKVPKQL